jgi:hypothetical protein
MHLQFHKPSRQVEVDAFFSQTITLAFVTWFFFSFCDMDAFL